VYGPNSGHKSSVVAKFIKQALREEVCELYGDGGQTRDYIYIDDLVSAVICAIQLDAEHNAGRNVSILAELGQYLGDDCDGYLSTEAERLQRTLNNLKG